MDLIDDATSGGGFGYDSDEDMSGVLCKWLTWGVGIVIFLVLAWFIYTHFLSDCDHMLPGSNMNGGVTPEYDNNLRHAAALAQPGRANGPYSIDTHGLESARLAAYTGAQGMSNDALYEDLTRG